MHVGERGIYSTLDRGGGVNILSLLDTKGEVMNVAAVFPSCPLCLGVDLTSQPSLSTQVTWYTCDAVWQLVENSRKTVDVILHERGDNPYDITIPVNVTLTDRDVAWTKYLVTLQVLTV